MKYTPWQQIGPHLRVGLLQSTPAAVLIGLLAGTGGEVSRDRILMYSGTGSVIVSFPVAAPVTHEQGLVVELNTIRQALRLSVAEIANLFSVSRPTIYSWQNGKQIGQQNSERLRAILNALTPHLNLLGKQVGRVAHRAIEGKTTLLQKLAAGENAERAIMELLAILGGEAEQRERLSRRLQGRTGKRGVADLDALG